jgi:4-amino-4-deoxy-L-arabinose transferase-like glycosyltransferase
MLLGAAFLLKQPAAIAAIPLGIYLLLPSYRTGRSLTRANSIIQATMLTVGFFAALGLVAIVLWKQGILRDAFYWTIADHDIPHVFWEKGILLTLAFIGTCLPLVLGAILACRDDNEIWAARRPERTALFGLLAASAIGVAAGGRFYAHYYVQLIPPLALLAAPYYARLWSRTMQPPHWILRPAVTYAWLALTVIALSIIRWIELAPRRVPSEAGGYLSMHSSREDRIFVWARLRKCIWTLVGVLPVVTSQRFRSRVMFSADGSRVSILAAGSCPARGKTCNGISPHTRPLTLSMFRVTREPRGTK